MVEPPLTPDQKLELYYWMQLTRVFDERMLSLWKQGRGVGGTFSQRGHEATSVGAAYALNPEDALKIEILADRHQPARLSDDRQRHRLRLHVPP